MRITAEQIQKENESQKEIHGFAFDYLSNTLECQGISVASIIEQIKAFQVAIPSWALGAGGTRFGRFSFYGEPSTLSQKLEDVGVLHALTKSAGAISLHIPWDVPEDFAAIKEQAGSTKASQQTQVFPAEAHGTAQLYGQLAAPLRGAIQSPC